MSWKNVKVVGLGCLAGSSLVVSISSLLFLAFLVTGAFQVKEDSRISKPNILMGLVTVSLAFGLVGVKGTNAYIKGVDELKDL